MQQPSLPGICGATVRREMCILPSESSASSRARSPDAGCPCRREGSPREERSISHPVTRCHTPCHTLKVGKKEQRTWHWDIPSTSWSKHLWSSIVGSILGRLEAHRVQLHIIISASFEIDWDLHQWYRLLGKTKVSKFQLSSRFSWGIQQVFWLQVSKERDWNDFEDCFPFFSQILFLCQSDGNLCAIFISWRYFTAWQISFIIKAASFSVKASWSGFSSKKIGPSSCKLVQG